MHCRFLISLQYSKLYTFMIKNSITRCILSIILFLATTVLSAHSKPFDFKSEIGRLDSLGTREFRLAVDSLYFQLDRINDPVQKKALTEKVFSITAARDEMAHIRSLAYPVIYPDSIRVRYLNKAFKLAKKLKSKKEMAWLEERRCRYYMEKARYDSAMISILKIRDDYRPVPGSDEYINIENLLGDINYKAGLYEQAQKVYLGILDECKKSNQWNFWRPFVIMNNIGLVGIKTKNYQLAINWFNETLRMADIHLTIPEKNNIVAFTLVKLMECYIKIGRNVEARKYLKKVESIPQDEIYADVQQELMFWKSNLLLKEGNPKGALVQVQSLLTYADERPAFVRFNAEIDLLLSHIYKALNNPDKSLHYLENYTVVHDSLKNKSHSVHSLMLLANKDLQLAKEKLRASHREKMYMISILLFMVIVLLVVSLLYWRLYLSKLQLVNKTVEKEIQREKQTIQKYQEDVAGLPTEKYHSELDDLIDQLQKLVAEEKIYLDPELNIQKTAQYLSTNRTYLSTAINSFYDMNFPSYINQLRIQESIDLISKGYTSKLTLEALAMQSGFSSRTVFITAFKKYTGVPPSFFIKNYKSYLNKPVLQ